MSSDDDLARLLPESPPPRSNRRDAAIAAAMERFDGAAPATPPASSQPLRRGTWWTIPSAQMGAFASILLIAAISATLALHTPGGGIVPPSGQQVSVTPSSQGTAPAKLRAGDQPEAIASAKPIVSASAAVVSVPSSRSRVTMFDRGAADASRNEATPGPARTAPRPAPVPIVPAPAAPSARPSALVTAQAAAPYARAAKSTLPRIEIAQKTEDPSVNDIVVTGSRVSRGQRTNLQGDWNACTVDDPRKDLRYCRSSVGRAPNTAAVSVSEGLTRAWRGDWTAAVEAFTQAIAAKPRAGFGYLNRGLAYRHLGDLDRAAEDLDLAVRYDGDARSYYNRALFKRERGDERGAQVDTERAAELDPSYGDVSNKVEIAY